MRRLLQELKRRNVYKVGVVYVVVAFVVVQLADLAAGAFGLPGWFEPMIWVLCGLGLLPALVIAWAFEVTPEGVRRTALKSEREQDPADAGRTSTLFAAKGLVALGVLTAAAAGGWYLIGAESGLEPSVEDRSIAVLPFENMGGEESAQFTQGVHDGLLTRLSNVSDLRVISRTSVMQYQDTELDLPAIADSLGVVWIVEGGVQQAGRQVQVNAQLIQAEEDAHQWAQTYRRELSPENIFTIQSELTQEIARSLEAELTFEETRRVERRPTEDLEAYQLYVQGRRELARRTTGDMERAVRLFSRALERDSTFALAWAGLADAAGTRWWGYEGYDTLGVDPAEAARRALELAPNLAEARASMGFVHYRQRNGPGALRELQRAVDLRPSYAEAHNWLGLTYLVLGRPDQGQEHLQLAEELDPENLLARLYLYDTYIMRGQTERALPEIREQKRRYPEYGGTYVAETRALYALGRYEDAREVAREHMRGNGWRAPYLAATETALGDTARAQQRLDSLQQQGAPPLLRAYAHAALGDADSTMDAFEEVEEWSYVPTGTVRYMTFPEGMARIRDHPRYEELIREINQAWGLNPDGTLPDSVDVSFDSQSDE